MFSRPNMADPVDRLAHYLSEVHNDSAPMGWETYRPLAISLIRKFDIIDTVKDDKFFEWDFKAGVYTTEGYK